jgi:hypothetical protein
MKAPRVLLAALFCLVSIPVFSASFTFSNTAPITINISGPAATYPSNIAVSGVGRLTGITVTLHGLSHTWPDDLQILLAGADSSAFLMGDAGSSWDLNGVTLTFSDLAVDAIPNSTQIFAGTYRPAAYGAFSFPAPAPTGPYAATLSTFLGADPTGTWSLYIVDDAGGDSGSLSGGWSLTFETADVPEPATSALIGGAFAAFWFVRRLRRS